MSYVSLARKLRPSRFDELIGQDTTALILRNAILSDRVAHAFLFAGSRGVGKTSAARILTRALNCLNLDKGDPCNNCENCIEINKNASPDIYEIDAASNRGIDNIRELRENINYVPARCRYKIYIIDEAHMLTLESFNALLKTLEEPPPYVKFILATTDPHKIPQTILSRCQRYDFLRISIKNISDYLEKIVKNEKINISRKALEIVARNSVGGMRDALTAMDQILSFGGETVSDQKVAQILGILDNESRFEITEALLNKREVNSIQLFQKLQEHGHDANDILKDLLHTIKTISLVRNLGTDPALFQDIPPDDLEIYDSLSKVTTADELQQIFNILLQLEERLKLSSHEKICFEMAILQITSIRSLVGINELINEIKSIQKGLYPNDKVKKNESIEKMDESEIDKYKEQLNCESQNITENKKNVENSTTFKNKLKSQLKESQKIKEESKEKNNSSIKINLNSTKNKSQEHDSTFDEKHNFISKKYKISENVKKTKDFDSEGMSVNSQKIDFENNTPPRNAVYISEKPTQEWINFSKDVQKRSPKLASFIRNSIPQSLEGSKLELTFKNVSYSSMFTDSNRDVLREIASEFCGREIHISCNVSQIISSKLTIAEFEEIKLEEKNELKRKNARENFQVNEILSVFNNSKIDDIKLSND